MYYFCGEKDPDNVTFFSYKKYDSNGVSINKQIFNFDTINKINFNYLSNPLFLFPFFLNLFHLYQQFGNESMKIGQKRFHAMINFSNGHIRKLM